MNILSNTIPPKQPNKTYVSIDTEWYDLNQYTIHRPTSGKFACLTASINGEDVYFTQDEQTAVKILDQLQNCIWLIHEAKFDLTQLSRFASREITHHSATIDTLMMEKELFSGYYDRFGLGHLARRHLGTVVEKELQKSFHGSEMTPEQIQYACTDAIALRQIWNQQKTHITKDAFYVYKNIDLPTMFAVMDFQGFCIDVDGWKSLAQQNKAKQEALDLELTKLLPCTARQYAKLKDFLRKNGFPKLDSTQEDELKKALAKHPDTLAGKATQMILDSRMYGKRASTYGEKWLDNYIETDGTNNYVVCNYDIYGTETGRFSASDPPMQTIPQRETKDYRKLFIPRKGHVLLVGDYSQQEVGIEAFVSQDQKLISLFNQGGDIYIATAKEMMGKTITKKDPLRALMKSLVLGMDYGLSKYGLSKKMNISVEEAEEHIRKFLRTFPGINEYQCQQRKETSFVKTILGRRIWLNPYSFQCENNALNAPIQGSAADMLKISISQMHKDWAFPFPFALVAAIHDELVMDVPKEYAHQGQEFMQSMMESMANWICPGIHFRAEVKICPNSWAEKELE